MVETIEKLNPVSKMDIGQTKKVKIKDLYDSIKNDGGTFEILTPFGFQKMGDVYNKTNKSIFYIKLENGFELKGSEDHLVLIDTTKHNDDEVNQDVEILDNNIWIRLSNIRVGDFVFTEDGKSYKILKKDFIGIDDTYDLEVLNNDHSYISNGIISHNTGKTALVDALAQRIIERRCSRVLFNKRIYSLDMGSLVQGTKYRGMMEERVKALMTELENNPDIILFIDEIHTMIGAGGASGSLDVANMFKPALSRGEIQVIGATTLEEYRKHIEKDSALERRFQKIIVNPSSPEETIQILNNIKKRYEDHHKVIYTPEALKACVDLTNRYMSDRFLPDKAIDALDEAGARVHISNIVVPAEVVEIEAKIQDIKDKKTEVVRSQRYEEAAKLRDVEKQLITELDNAKRRWDEAVKNDRQTVTEENVAQVVSLMTGIPLSKVGIDENTKLSQMYNNLAGKVIGQEEAVKKVVKAVQKGRVGMKDPNKPIATFLFIGDTGTGKTHLTKELAKYIFESEDNLIRLDMSEYMDKISINKIQGSAPGYVGYDDANVLDKIRRKPYSVILLDEIEKANPDVFNLFLQMFDEGHMTDSHGKKVDFKNTIIIMTSNIGVRKVKEFGTGVGFATTSKKESDKTNQESVIMEEVKKKFAPEFINRIDSIVMFNNLNNDDIKKIVNLELDKVYKRVIDLEYTLSIDDSMIEQLVKVGYDPKFGARPLKRAVSTWVEDPITEFIIEKNPVKGSKLVLKYNSDGDDAIVEVVNDTPPKKTRTKKAE
jgi:ATP-dependent Clp protease ATP-binding subunit ClpC